MLTPDDSHSGSESQAQVPSRARVHRLPGAKPTERGVLYRRGGERFLLAWNRVQRAFAAEVGEAGAGRAVFDLAIETTGPECVLCRLDAAPGEEAMLVAKAIQVALDDDRCNPCVHSLADGGLACRHYPDLEIFTESVLEAIRFG